MSAADAPRGDPREELEALFPDREVRVRDPDTGEDIAVTVREYRYLEGLEAAVEAAPLLAALAEGYGPDGRGDGPAAAAIEAAMARHAAVWLRLLARATGREADWLARLSAADGDVVGNAMWSVNVRFFIARVVALLAARRAKRSPSPGSSTPSSAPDTGAATKMSRGG